MRQDPDLVAAVQLAPEGLDKILAPAAAPCAAQSQDFLGLCIARYDGLLDSLQLLQRRASPSTVLKFIKLAAVFATNHHPGRFSDGALERPLLELGDRLPKAQPLWFPEGPRAAAHGRTGPRVVHIASRVFDVGGHTRMIVNWAAADRGSPNTLLLVSQHDVPVPPRLQQQIEATGGSVCQLPHTCSFLDKAGWIKEFVRQRADVVVLHIGQDDVATFLALSEPGGPPVAHVNQAAHVFWLGSGVADGIINLREPDSPMSRTRRYMRRDFPLPIPLDDSSLKPSYSEARQRLGIPQDQMVLLSIGRGVKYVASDQLNFFRAADRILERNSSAHLYIVGVGPQDRALGFGHGYHERLHCVGTLSDPSWFQAAADLYLEGFPFGSQTAFLEAAMAGLPAVPAPTTRCRLIVTDDPALTGIVTSPVDEAQYVDQITQLIAHHADCLELGQRLSKRVRDMHTGDGWRAQLEQLYDGLTSLAHSPIRIPVSSASLSEADQEVSSLHRLKFQGQDASRAIDAWLRTAFEYWASDLGEEGELRGALSFLRLAQSHGSRAARISTSATTGMKRWLHRILTGSQ